MYSRKAGRKLQWKSRLGVAFLAALTVVSCRQVLPPPEPPAHRGVTVRIACPAELTELVELQARPWQARQQARVEVVPIPPGKAVDTVERADVWVIRPAELPSWAAPGRLRRLPEAFTARGSSFDWGGLLPLYRQDLLLWQQVPYGVPLQGEVHLCIYRADLFASDTVRQRFRAWQAGKKLAGPAQELRPPLTWDEFALLAEFFRDQHPSGTAGPSLPPLPSAGADLDEQFYLVAAGSARRAVRQDEPPAADALDALFSFQYDPKTGAPRIGEPGFVAGLRMLARLQACRPPQRQPQPAAAFLTGQAVLGIVRAEALLPLQQAPALRDRLGITVLPGAARYYTADGKEKTPPQGYNRMPYLGGGGWLAVVPTSAPAAEAAFDLLADLAGPTRSAQAALEPRWGGAPVRVEQLLRERWDAYDLDRTRTQALKEAVTATLLQHGLKNPAVVLRIPDQAAHRDRLVAGLERVLLHGADPAATLAAVADAWRELDRRKGPGQARIDYRLSVGLLKD